MSEAPDRDSKTELPTPKRLADAKKKGQGPFSRELPVMFNVSAIWASLSMLLGAGSLQVVVALRPFIDRPEMWDLRSGADASNLLVYISLTALVAALPILAVIAASGLVGSLVQYNGVSLTRLKPEFSRISPMAGWKRIFGRTGLANNAKSLLKIGLVAAIAAWSLHKLAAQILSAGALQAAGVGRTTTLLLVELTRNLLAVIIVIAGIDALWARYTFIRDLMMTKQEVKDEAKEADGDQALKQRMRMVARQRLKKRMMAAVPQATVVIANPTHFAVALRYVRSEGGAPRVVAKGKGAMALRIRAVAEANGVPVVENKPLARALYDAAALDAFLPPEFYRAVAEIISAIMRRGGGAVGAPNGNTGSPMPRG